MTNDLDEDVISMIVEEVEEWLSDEVALISIQYRQTIIDSAIEQLTRDFGYDTHHQEEVAEARRRLAE